MLTLITVSICLCFILLTGWTGTTYFIKQESQQIIVKELKNLFNICKQFFISLKKLIVILGSHSFSSKSSEASSVKKKTLEKDEEPLSLIYPVQETEAQSFEPTNEEEDDDIAISSFSPQVIEVINEEEEKVA